MPKLLTSLTQTAVALTVTGAAGCALLPTDPFGGPPPIIDGVAAERSVRLRRDVEALAGRIGERNTANPAALESAENFAAASLARAGHAVRSLRSCPALALPTTGRSGSRGTPRSW